MFDELSFLHPLRGYQKEIIELAHQKLNAGERELNIVAPPGAGKTIIGLQLICDLKIKTLVLCPNTTIQNQWIKKLDLFISPESQTVTASDFIGKSTTKPQPISVHTYQALSTPEREQELIINCALSSWLEEINGDQERIDQMRDYNPKAYAKELSRHKRKARRKLMDDVSLDQILHPKAVKLVQSLKDQNFGLVVLDECHHLTDYWASVISKVIDYLDNPLIIGLTATPPEGKSNQQKTRYLKLVGDIDYEVPTPALVKDGSLAPYQDLVYFTRPTKEESTYIAEHSKRLHELIEKINNSELFKGWLYGKSKELRNGLFLDSIRNDEKLTVAMCRAIWLQKLELPEQVDQSPFVMQEPDLDEWLILIEDFCLRYLKISPDELQHSYLSELKVSLRMLGYNISETGISAGASTVNKTLALSSSKADACCEILAYEYGNLEAKLRAAIVCDYEGAALAVFERLLKDNVAMLVHPVLVTGSRLQIDPSLQKKVQREAKDGPVEFKMTPHSGMSVKGVEQSVKLVTSLLEKGATQCLIGTRGILGEGWDSPSLNTLIDLTAITTATGIKQLRGRSLRKSERGIEDLDYQLKVANNWDIICVYPQMEKGLNDFNRFDKKHKDFFGLSFQDNIECGIRRLHPAFSDLEATDIFASQDDFNQEMLNRAIARDAVYKRWKIGQAYENKSKRSLEVVALPKLSISPPFVREHQTFIEHRRYIIGQRLNLVSSGTVTAAILAGLLFYFGRNATIPGYSGSGILPAVILVFVTMIVIVSLRLRSLDAHFRRDLIQVEGQITTATRILTATLEALKQCEFAPPYVDMSYLEVIALGEDGFRVSMQNVDPVAAKNIARSLEEVMMPVINQPYVIPKYEYSAGEMEPDEYFKHYLAGDLTPYISSYHPVPSLLARSAKGRDAFEKAWNEHVSPGSVVALESNPEDLNKYFGIGPSVAQRMLWS
ncbi:MAG: DEAD/DEAH box helicase family protein [Candidatus Melainabacteria bacterium]|nr:DEAD/DEAH box helicase family protein [Candidatus Melainabacteria bacterium]